MYIHTCKFTKINYKQFVYNLCSIIYGFTYICLPIDASKASWLATNYECGKAYGLLFVAMTSPLVYLRIHHLQYTYHEISSVKLPAVLICQTFLSSIHTCVPICSV